MDSQATSIVFDDEFVKLMSNRAKNEPNTPLIRQGDEFWVVMKTTAGPGTTTGVGGYQTFYVPDGVDAIDAAYVFPDKKEQLGFVKIPMKGQSPIAIGDGDIGSEDTPELIGWSLPGTNGLGFSTAAVSASGADRGTLAGVYADTGIFFSTDPRTAFNSYGAAITGGSPSMKNNSGDNVGEYFANGVNNAVANNILGVMTLWDSQQLEAYGRDDVNPLLDGDGRGNAPWGLANAVAGPQSGYAWDFNAATYRATAGSTTAKLRAAIGIGPWQRIQYPGSQISQDQPGLKSKTVGNVGIDASMMGISPSAIPANANAIRFAIGQLELGRPELSAVKVRIADAVPDCLVFNGDAFGGDAGGADNGKDHIWRYFDPTLLQIDTCIALQKVAENKIVKVGSNVKYDITFINNGSTTIPNVRIVDQLPQGLEHVSGKPTPNIVNGKTITWIIGDVAPYSVVTVQGTAKATSAGSLVNTAIVTSNNTPIITVTEVIESRNQSLIFKGKTVDQETASRGDVVEYTLTVENKGTIPSATPMVITDYLPAGFTYQQLVSAKLDKSLITTPVIAVNSSNPSTPVFTLTQGIKEGKSLTLVFTAKIGDNVPDGSYCNSFQVRTPDLVSPPIPEACVEVGGGTIGDTIFNDWNGNGTQDAGEEGIAGVVVELYASNGTTLLESKTTNSNGNYFFNGLAIGTYVVKVGSGVASGSVLTADPDATLDGSHTVAITTPSQIYLLADFGYQPGGTASIGDVVFEDVGNDGIYNPGIDSPINGATVSLYEDSNGDGVVDPVEDLFLGTQVTDANGFYQFTGLAAGLDYITTIVFNDPGVVANFGVDPYAASTPLVQPVPNLTGAFLDADFGFWGVVPATIGDQLFIDANADGLFNGGETPIGNVTVWLDTNNNGVIDPGEPTTVSSPNGIYLFQNLGENTYTVRVDLNDPDIPTGHTATVSSYTVMLTSGQTFLEADFPFVPVFSKAVDQSVAAVGDFLTYTMIPYWPGPDLLTNAKVADSVPVGTTFVSAGQGGGTNGILNSPAINGSHPGSVGSGAVNAPSNADAWLNDNAKGTNYGSTTTMSLDSAGGGQGDGRPVVRFDLSGLPIGVTITGATLRLHASSVTDAENRTVVVYPLTQAFVESQVTWNSRATATSWSSAGGAFGASVASTNVGGVGPYTWTSAGLTTLVQNWYSGSATNFGLLLGDTDTGTVIKNFATKENATEANRPVLQISYTGGVGSAATTTSIAVTPSTVTDSGSGANVTVSMTATANGAVTGITPGALSVIPGANGASATLVSGPTGSPANIGSGGGSATFTWVYNVTAGSSPDQVAFVGTPTGTGATFGQATSNGVVVSVPTSGDLVCWDLGSNTPRVDGSGPGAPASSNTVTLTSVADNEIWSDQPNTNYETEDLMWIERTNNYLNRLAIRFDLSSIPANATITSAVMTLNRRSGNSSNPAIAAHRFTQPWTEAGATWNSRSAGVPWSGAGAEGDYAPVATATTNVAANGEHDWQITSMVQGWVNGTNPNYGVLMRLPNQVANGEHEFYTREQNDLARRPRLAISYTVQAAPNTTTALSVTPSLVTDGGSGVNAEVTMTVTATGAVTGITPNALTVIPGSNGATATLVSGPVGSPASISSGGGSATFTWVYNLTAGVVPDQVKFSGTASGTGVTFASATSNSVIVTPPLTMTVQINDPAEVGVVTNTAQYFNGPTFLAEDTVTTALTASIGDYVWADLNGDGIQDANEFGLSGVTVNLYDSTGTTLLNSTTTDSDGLYRFFDLSAGDYIVAPDLTSIPSGYVGTTPSAIGVTLVAFQQFDDADFGFDLLPPGTGSIGDFVWLDTNGDQVQDLGEPGLEGIEVILERFINGEWSEVSSVTTDSSGAYGFSGLPDGSYRVTVNTLSLIPSPYSPTTHTLEDATVQTFDKDGLGTPNSALVTLLGGGQVIDDLDFGYTWDGTIGDYVWYDDNQNGVNDEPASNGISNAEVLLYHDVDGDGVINTLNGDVQIANVFTNPDGTYLFTGLPPGDYLVDVYEDSFNDDAVPTTQGTIRKSLSGTETFLDADFGYFIGARLDVTVFWDENSNGFNDGSEPLLSGITVTLTGTDNSGNPVTETLVTSGTGSDVFIVPPGNYTISYSTTDTGSLYPALGTQTTPIFFDLVLVGGDENAQSFEFGLDNAGVIGDTIFADTNGDGSQSLSEPGLSDVTVYLYLDADGNGIIDPGAGDSLLAITSTDGSGFYEFTGLADTSGSQEYLVQVVTASVPSDYLTVPTAFPAGANPVTSEYSTTLTGAQVIDTVDFGYPLIPATFLTISGTIYHDNGNSGGTASNGTQDGGEPGLNSVNVTISVDSDSDGIIDIIYIVPTDSSGNYSVGGIPEGADVIITVDELTLPNSGFFQTGDPDGGVLSNVWPITNLTTNATDLDFGYLEQLASISGTVVEGDGNGIADFGEPAVGGVTVTLTDAGPDGFFNTADDIIVTTLTDLNGDYSFTGLPPGEYKITTTVPAVFVPFADSDGSNPNSIDVSLTAGEVLIDQDFEYRQPAIFGVVFEDLNGLDDSTVNGTGTNVSGAIYANLVDPSDNTVIASVLVASDGDYFFGADEGVQPNTSYLIILTSAESIVGSTLTASNLPPSWSPTGENLGSGPGDDGTPNSVLAVTIGDVDLENANFGIVRRPDITPVITAIPNIMRGPTNFVFTIRVTELDQVATKGQIIVRVPKDTRWTLNGAFDPNLTTLASTALNNSEWTYTQDAFNHIFISDSVIAPGSFSMIGFRASWNAGLTRGIYTATSQIDSGSGDETRIDNNVDAEKIDYFIE